LKLSFYLINTEAIGVILPLENEMKTPKAFGKKLSFFLLVIVL